MREKKIAVLALQGDFAEHCQMLESLGAEVIQLRQLEDLEKKFDGLVLPGGESTAQGKLLQELGMLEGLREKICQGLPVLATCAGLILLAKELSNDERRYLQTLPVTVKRNAYGRQTESFYYEGEMKGIGRVPMKFIRAPYIEKAWTGVEILGRVEGRIVAVQYKNQLALSFHPEVTGDSRIHQYFLEMAESTLPAKENQ